MQMEQDQHDAWREHINQYATCPSCGADGELEGTSDVVDPGQPGDPVRLREQMECPACGCVWWESWIYSGREVVRH